MAEISQNRLELARAFAKEYGCILVLKGAASIITDGNVSYINSTGNAGLAKAGSGDVLSGVILGVCAQNNIKEETPLNVVSAAFINGMAGEIAQMKSNEISMTALDTVNSIAEAISKIKG